MSSSEVSASGRSRIPLARRASTAWLLAVTILFISVFSIGLFRLSQDGHPLSVVDEHIHFDTAAKALQGTIPWRGALMGEEVIHEWACGVGHEAGALPYPCGDPRLTADALPSGKYTSGYIHYPTYFFAAAAYERVVSTVRGSTDLLNAFRAFSALTMILGVILCGIFAWLLGLRRFRLLAAVFVPIASTMVVFPATIVNPSSTAVLAGALIGGTTLLWMKRNKGFLWVALAVALCACIAVTSSLPAGGTLIAMLIVLVGRRWGLRLTTAWAPRWWQFAVLASLVLAPIAIWGRVTAARATVPNSALYGFLPPSRLQDVLLGALGELSSLHTPWLSSNGIHAVPHSFWTRAFDAVAHGISLWITVAVFGTIVVCVVASYARGRRAAMTVRVPDRGYQKARLLVDPAGLFAVGLVATVVLYPPMLRFSNWLNFGFDAGIVDRYSNAFTAALVLALLVWMPVHPRFTAFAAVVATVAAIGTVAAGL